MKPGVHTPLAVLRGLARHRADGVMLGTLAASTGAGAKATPPRAGRRCRRCAAELRTMRPRSSRRAVERGWAFALQLMPVAVLVGGLLAAAAVHDGPAPIACSNQGAEQMSGSSGHPSRRAAPGGGAETSGAPTSATTREEPSGDASDGGELATPTEPARAPGAGAWLSVPPSDVPIPQAGVRHPRLGVSLPRGAALVGSDGSPNHPSPPATPSATGGPSGPGPAPVALLLASLVCLAVATSRRIRAKRRLAGRVSKETGAETVHLPAPAEHEADSVSPPAPAAEAVEVPGRRAAPPRPATPHPWDQPPRPPADADLDADERSPAPLSDQGARASAAGAEAGDPPSTTAPHQEREPLDTLTVRPAGTVIYSRSAPDDPGEDSRHDPVTGPILPGEGTIIRAPKPGRIRR